MTVNKEVYVKKWANSEILTTKFQVFDAQEDANKSDYLPHNKLRIANRSVEIIYIYLDGYQVGSSPDYVLGADKVLDESFSEGVNFNSLIIQNQSVNTISADSIFVRVASVREI